MPSIRLADIPNAPGAGAPALQRNTAVMPDMPSVPRDAALDSSSLLRGAASLRERQVDPSGTAAGILALRDLGRAVKEAAGVPADLAVRMQRAQNTADIARADVIMRDAFSSYQEEMMQIPEDQWEWEWKANRLKSVHEKISSLNLSQAAKDQLAPDLIQWEGATSIQIRTQAAKQKINNNRMAVNNAKDRAVLDGDLDLAIAHIRNGVASQLFSEAEGEAAILDIEAKVRAKAKEDQANGIAMAIEIDPSPTIPELEKAARGEPSIFGEMEPLKAKRFLSMARQENDYRKIELRDELHNQILTGEILDRETLRVRAGGRLDEKALLSLEKSMGGEIPFDPEKFSQLRTAIVGYDGNADLDGSQLDKIVTAIQTTVPQNMQRELRNEINHRWTSAVRKGEPVPQMQKFASSLYTEIDGMAKRGVFGQYETKKIRGKTVVDEAKKMEVWTKAEGYKQEMHEWLQKNPEASPEDAIDHFSTLLNPELQEAANRELKQMINTAEKASLLSRLATALTDSEQPIPDNDFAGDLPTGAGGAEPLIEPGTLEDWMDNYDQEDKE